MRALMQVPLVDLRAQYAGVGNEVDAAIRRVVESGNFILGDEVRGFEAEFAQYVQARDAVGVASGTAAIELVLRALDIGPGDEVITSAHTFIATAEAISNVGARPVFADVDAGTYALEPNHVAALVTPRTRAILPVHLYGHPAPMGELSAIARQHGIFLVEDAAQAHGAEVDGRRCGSLGDAACFSFYPGKNLGAYGDAGAVTSNDPDLIEKVRRLRDHGRTSKYEHEIIGQASRMDAIQAAVLSVKLKHLEDWTELRRQHARRYSELLRSTDLGLPMESPGARHVYHLYVVRSASRDALFEHLRDAGISAGIHYPLPLHRQPAYLALGYGGVSLPATEAVAATVLSLPMYPELTDDHLRYVSDALRTFAS